MSRTQQIIHFDDSSFVCIKCGMPVAPAQSGGRNRNHCPHCLWSRHLDLNPGDRRSPCRAPMEPIAVWIRRDGECCLLHRCERCGSISANRIAADDKEERILKLALKPVTQLPFPLEA